MPQATPNLLTLGMQVGSYCGAAYLQAKTAFVFVRTGMARMPDVAHVSDMTWYAAADRRLRTKQTGHHECRCSQGDRSHLILATQVQVHKCLTFI